MIIARFWDRSLIYNSQLLSFGSVHFSCSVVSDFATLWTTACQASLSITNSQSLLTPMSIESVTPSNHLILCHPFLLPPSIFPSIKVFSNESVLHIRWPKYWSFSFSISPSNEYSGVIFFRMDWLDLLAVQGTLKSLLQSLDLSTFPHSPPPSPLVTISLFPMFVSLLMFCSIYSLQATEIWEVIFIALIWLLLPSANNVSLTKDFGVIRSCKV